MKRLIFLLFSFLTISVYSQTVLYPGTRIFTGELQIAANAQFNFKGNYLITSQIGDTIGTVEGIRLILAKYTLKSDTVTLLATKYGLSAKINYSDTVNLIATKSWVNAQGFLTAESDPVWLADSSRYISKSQARSDIHDSISGIITVETDPIYSADSAYLKEAARTINDTVYLGDIALLNTDTTLNIGSKKIATKYDINILNLEPLYKADSAYLKEAARTINDTIPLDSIALMKSDTIGLVVTHTVLGDTAAAIRSDFPSPGITTLNQTFSIGNAFTLDCGDIKVIASRTNSSFGVYSPADNIYYQYDDLTTTHTFNGFVNFNSLANFAVLPTYNSHGLFNQTYSIADSFALQTGTLRLVLDDHRSRFSLWDNGSEQFYYDEPSAKFKFNCTLDDLNASNITASGDISYNVRHGLMHISGASYTPNVTQNIPFKLTPGMTNYETPVGMTLAGDTAICVTPGAYNFSIGMTLSGANAVDWEIAAFVNSVQYTDYFTVTTTGATNFITASWFWYIDLVANDKVSFKIINISDSSDPTIKNMKIDYIKLHN